MGREKSILDPKTKSLNEKLNKSGVKVKHRKEKTRGVNDLGKNKNGAYTSNGSNTQNYNSETKQFEKTSGRSKYGRLAVEGETNAASAKTHAMTVRDDDGNLVRQSGRSGLATRRQRYYDIRKGLGLSGG